MSLTVFLAVYSLFSVSVQPPWSRPALRPDPDVNKFAHCGKKSRASFFTSSQPLTLGRHGKFCPGYCLYGNNMNTRSWRSYIISAPNLVQEPVDRRLFFTFPLRNERVTYQDEKGSCTSFFSLNASAARPLITRGTKGMKKGRRPWAGEMLKVYDVFHQTATASYTCSIFLSPNVLWQ